MILKGIVLHLRVNLRHYGEGNGTLVFLVYTGRLKYGSQDLGIIKIDPQNIS